MEGISVKELWMLLGEKDVQIYQLLKENEQLTIKSEALAKKVNDLIEGSTNG